MKVGDISNADVPNFLEIGDFESKWGAGTLRTASTAGFQMQYQFYLLGGAG